MARDVTITTITGVLLSQQSVAVAAAAFSRSIALSGGSQGSGPRNFLVPRGLL